ncbi:MAG TPA: YbdK family carboxylate-amine ligase [Baekduia sp.]|nr:YbdK family carboxylate-amine ligase [Baekduia sp.]
MSTPRLPAWADWNPAAAENAWTVGIEEEIMLVDPHSYALVSRNKEVLDRLSATLGGQLDTETHASAVEIETKPHATVSAAVAEIASLRSKLAAGLRALDVRAAVSGTHPFAMGNGTEVSAGPRYVEIHDTMRELARREPTFAQHVHVAVPDAESATRALSQIRTHLPLLLGLAANSPFWRGRDSGMASARTPVFSAFPRVGIPRRFDSYAEYVEAIDGLLRLNAFPEPTFVWWDVRLQPRFGTIELRITDAQSQIANVAALTALIQCTVRLEATEGFASAQLGGLPEIIDENRFLASRDGVDGEFLDPDHGCARPARAWIEDLVSACEPHARDLGCEAELAGVAALAADPGYSRQRALLMAKRPPSPGSSPFKPVLAQLCDEFADDG